MLKKTKEISCDYQTHLLTRPTLTLTAVFVFRQYETIVAHTHISTLSVFTYTVRLTQTPFHSALIYV